MSLWVHYVFPHSETHGCTLGHETHSPSSSSCLSWMHPSAHCTALGAGLSLPWGHLLVTTSQVGLGAGVATLLAVEPVAAHAMLRYQVAPVEEVFAEGV